MQCANQRFGKRHVRCLSIYKPKAILTSSSRCPSIAVARISKKTSYAVFMNRVRAYVGASKQAASNASKHDDGKESATSPAVPNSESDASRVRREGARRTRRSSSLPKSHSSLSLAKRSSLAQDASGQLCQKGLIRHRHTLLDRNLWRPAGCFDLRNISQLARRTIWLRGIKSELTFIADSIFD